MQRLFRRSPLVQCPVEKAMHRHPCRLVVPNRSGLRDEVAQLNTGKSPVEELSGETNTMVTDVMDIDRTPELLTWLFSSFFGRRANQPTTTSPTTLTPTEQATNSSPKSSPAPQSPTPNLSATPSAAATAAATVAESSVSAASAPANAPENTTPYDQPSTSPLKPQTQSSPPNSDRDQDMAPKIEIATVGGGCFWCMEACFLELEGVLSATSGYAGGYVPNPTYQQVCSKTTGHAEVVQIKYDANVLSYKDVLQIFMALHDPTTPNRSGNDVGPQYRSIILTQDDSQVQVAAEVLAEANRALWFGRKVCTEVAPLTAFYSAESYHQRYYSRNPGAGYCVFVVRPKLQELRRKYAKRLRRNASLPASSL